MAFFSTHGVSLEIRDVDRDFAHLKRMVEISGQSLTPTFEYDDFLVADFSVDEFIDELQERPDIRAALGIMDLDHST